MLQTHRTLTQMHSCFLGSFQCVLSVGHVAQMLHTSIDSNLPRPALNANISFVARACNPGKSLMSFSQYCCCCYHEPDRQACNFNSTVTFIRFVRSTWHSSTSIRRMLVM
jgi:hypothetical protein